MLRRHKGHQGHEGKSTRFFFVSTVSFVFETVQTNLHSALRTKDAARNVRVWLSLLGSLYTAILFAGLIAPYAPNEQNRNLPFVSPTRLHFVDTSGRGHVRPFVYRLVRR